MRFIVALAVAAMSVFFVFPSFPAEISLATRTTAGVMYGMAKELVFDGSFTLSELDWALQPVYYTGVSLELKTAIGLAASLAVRSGISGLSGYITDSDWLNYSVNGDTRKTNFSQHNCFTERAFLLDARVGWDFRILEWLALEAFGKFSIMQFKWTARDGYVQYPPGWFSASPPPPPFTPWSQDTATTLVSGTGIIYEQNYLIPALGLSARVRLSKQLDVAASFTLSPFVSCNDLDNHEFTATDYTEKMSKGLLLEPEVSVGWQINDRARLSLEVSYRSITGLIGDSYEIFAGPGYTPGEVAAEYADSGGAAFDALNASLSFLLSL
jgi:outer membrane protease